MFDTVAIEPQGRIQDSMLGGQYLKHEIFSCERRRREAMLGRGGVVMNWHTFTHRKQFQPILRVVATSLRVNVSVLIHRMHECEFCRCQARVRGSGACFPRIY